MQLNISRTELARVVGAVGKVVEARNTIPILSNILLEADGDRLSVTGTDLDIQATAAAEATIQKAGKITVSAKLLGDIVRKAAGDTISIELKDGRLHVKAGRSNFNLETLPAADYPDLASGTYAAEFEIDLAALFAPVAFAISADEVRYYLGGIFLHNHGDDIVAVATDGHRMAVNSSPIETQLPAVIVPRKTAAMLPKGSVNVSVSDTKIRIQAGEFVMVSKLIDGTFPDYRRVMPSGNDKIVAFDRDALMKASDRVATVSAEKGRAVKFSVAPGGISLSVRSDAGDATDEIEADYSSEPVDIGFNAAYVRDMLNAIPPGQTTFALADSGSPALVRSASAPNWTGVCMPMRV